MVFCIGVSFPIPPTGCCYSFLDLWSNTIIGSSCNSVCDVCNHSLNGLCIVKESRLQCCQITVFVLMDLRSCQDSSTKCNFCNHIVISYGVQKQADPTEGPLHLEPLKTKQNKTLLLVLVGDMQRAGIVVTPPTFTFDKCHHHCLRHFLTNIITQSLSEKGMHSLPSNILK
jgi:hypothetical protein